MTFDNALKYRIVNHLSAKVCGLLDSGFVAQVQKSPITALDWRIIQLQDNSYEIKSESTDRFWRGLSFTKDNDKVKLDHWRFAGNQDQRWIIEPIGETGLYKIKDSYSNLALTVKDCSTNDNAWITLEKFTDRECQKWRIEK